MMMILMTIIFMIPLCFINFWLVQYFLFICTLLFIFKMNFNNFFVMISYIYGYDGMSSYFILLSCWICSLMILSSSKININCNFKNYFIFIILFLLIMLILVFSSLNLFLFYIYFEVSLIPLMILIIGWGYQPERLMAGMYLIFYTILFSLPMMVGLFIVYYNSFSMMFFELKMIDNMILYFFINMVFFVKIPMFGIHLWLPKAHVEAPVSGSMILAGVTLKLGGYGMIRLMKILYFNSIKFNLFFIVYSLMGGLIVSLICMYQTDLKSLIAYSSVSHMSLVMSSILTLNLVGFLGSLILMLGHGLCSSGLFCLANIYYERINSRSMYIIKGLINLFPNLGLFMFMLSVNNMAAPPSLNLVGEILIFNSLIGYNQFLMLVLIVLSFFSAIYSIYLFSYTNHGLLSSSIYSIHSGLNREYLLLFLHWMPLNIMIFMGDMFMVY